MADMKALAKDTAVYGLSSIVGRFLNYLLVPLYTHVMAKDSGDYGVSTNMYAYTALLLVVLTFGMETTLFRFANKEGERPDTVFSTAMAAVGALSAAFLALVFGFWGPVTAALGYAAHPEYVLMMAAVVALDALQAIPFSFLRFKKRPVKFAALKLLFIILNIGLNCVYFLWLGKTQVFYVFLINLWCTGFITFFFIPDLLKVRWSFDVSLLKRMLSYSWPILVLGIAGILNQTADKMLFPLIYPDHSQGIVELGIYGACVKVAMIMAMITQAFRYAYEPFVFAQSKDKAQKDTYAQGMKYFVIFTLLAFLCVIGYMPILKHLVGSDYWAGLKVVPVVMAAEIMMGVYFNLSFWYKLMDRTIYGAWFSLAGCAVLLAVNVLFIPRYGYMACAWGGFAGYGTAMALSYAVGQRKFPIKYPLRRMGAYLLITISAFILMSFSNDRLPSAAAMGLNTILIAVYISYVLKKDMPLSSLPVIGRRFGKQG